MLIGDPYDLEDMVPQLPTTGVPIQPFRRQPLGRPRRRMVGQGVTTTADQGAMGEGWRNVLLDQLRSRGANFFGV